MILRMRKNLSAILKEPGDDDDDDDDGDKDEGEEVAGKDKGSGGKM